MSRGRDRGLGWTEDRKCIWPGWSWTETGKEDRALSERTLRQWVSSGSKAALPQRPSHELRGAKRKEGVDVFFFLMELYGGLSMAEHTERA